VKNGTVRGCGYGVVASGSLVEGMTLDGNAIGVMLRAKFGGRGNVIMSNTAMNSSVGFGVFEIGGNTLSTTSRRTTRSAFTPLTRMSRSSATSRSATETTGS
jgi:hypothetical protein